MGNPLLALSGLYWVATRRRVRGWGQLLVAASAAEQGYERWIRDSEPRLIARHAADKAAAAPLKIAVLVVTDAASAGAEQRSLASISAALGSTAEVRRCTGDADLRTDLDGLLTGSACQWLMLVLAGDEISPRMGELLPRTVAAAGDAALVYWDEDALLNGGRTDPWVKPHWDPLVFGRLGGLAGASIVSLPALLAAAGQAPFGAGRAALDQMLLAIVGNDPAKAVHIPLILTHRSERTRLPSALGPTEPHAPAAASSPTAKVSVIIPTRDRPDLIGPCLQKLRATDYPAMELIIVDNGTVDARALAIIANAEAEGATVIRDHGPFNFSRLNNRAAAVAHGEFLCFYNNDVEPIDFDWLQQLVRVAQREDSGAVGALLLYPSGRIQHAGVAVGMGGAAGHIQRGVDPAEQRFRTWHSLTREVSALTAAVMVVRNSYFEKIGGFDEPAFPVAFNDVDLCLRLRSLGLRNIFVAEAKLLHRESESRADDRHPERRAAFAAELAALQQRWHTEDFHDPFFSPLFLRWSERLVLEP